VSPRTIRRLVIVVFVAGIGGMIGGSIADNNGIAVTFGLITAAAAVGLILVTAVAAPGALGPQPGDRDNGARGSDHVAVDEEAARGIEDQVQRLVDAGADEPDVRELVRRSIAFGRRST
jgi:hypothetical protein